MAVVEIIEQLPGALGSWNLQSGHALSIKLKVRSDSRADGPMTIFGALPVRIGDAYRYPLTKPATETAAWLFVQNVSVDEVKPLADGGMIWTLSVGYSRLDPSKGDQGPVDEDGNRDPFAAPPRLSAYGQARLVYPTHDEEGGPLLNTAGEPFLPSDDLAVEESDLVFEVSRVERLFDLARLVGLKGRVNSAEWMGFPAGSILMLDIQPGRAWNDDARGWAWDVTYKLMYKPPVEVGGDVLPGHVKKVLNAGLHEKIAALDEPSGFKLVPCMHLDAPVSQPVALREDGRMLQPGDEPHYLYFDVVKKADFSALDFPTDLFTAGTPEPPPEEPEEP